MSYLDPQVLFEKFQKAELNKESDRDLWISAIKNTVAALDEGLVRVASRKEDGTWTINEWVKKAILGYFSISDMAEITCGPFHYFDKIPLKTNYIDLNVRVVPPAVARFGSFMEPGVVLMPSYVNIGAFVGARTMVDTWATVGSCAQIGSDVHLSGGVGIGGVLEPASARPVIVEDGAFLGSRCIVVEGVHIGREAVLGANVTLTSSTPIVDARSSQISEWKGFVPPRCVVVRVRRRRKLLVVPFLPAVLILLESVKRAQTKKHPSIAYFGSLPFQYR